MMRRNLTGLAMLLMALLIMAFLGLLIGACGRYENWWSMFCLAAIWLGACAPNVCHAYSSEPEEFMDLDVSPDRLHACQDFGWGILACMALMSWAVPIIVWYNEPLEMPWPGAIVAMVGITCWWMAYALWLRVFVKK